jgi:chorismate mutase
VSLVFSVTGDLDALNPASGLREAGRAPAAALFVVKEAEFRAGKRLPHCIRALLTCYMDEGTEPAFVYLGDAAKLRK